MIRGMYERPIGGAAAILAKFALCLGALASLLGAPRGSAQAEARTAAPFPASAAAARQIEASDREIARFFDGYMAKKIGELEVPGGAIVVVRNGRTILARGYGHADVAARRPVDVNRSLFRAASASKILPWILIMQLVEEGRLDLDKDVNAYLDFEIPEAFGRPITTRHLLTHTAGFPEHFHGLFDADQSVPLGQRLRDNVPKRVYAPGTTVSYSNYGAALAGYIVERLRGRPWEQVVSERIFGPLRMRHSTVSQPVPPTMRRDLVSTYHPGSDQPEVFRTSLAPMGALTASPADMGRLLLMLANGGQAEGGRVLTQATVRQMLSLQKPLARGLRDGMGLGFLVGSYRGVRYAGHAGNMTTLATDIEVLPDHGLAWYYAFNSQGAGEAARQVRDDLLRSAIARFVSPHAPLVRASGSSSARDVAGSYLSSRRIHSGPLMFSSLLNTVAVRPEPDGSISIESNGKVTHWHPVGGDRFVERTTGIPLAVERRADGSVVRMASAALYPVAIFERAPLLSWIVPFWAAIAFGIVILALLLKPFVWLVRRRRRAAAAGDATLADAGSRARVKRSARISFWLMMLTLAAWVTFGIVVAIDFAFLFEKPAALRYALGLLTLLNLPFAVAIAADAALAWRNGEGGVVVRIGNTLLALGAVAVATLFYTLEVTDLSTRW